MIRIKDIRVNPANPRVIRDDRFEKLVQSLKEFPKMLKLRPIIVDGQGVILAGNMRYKALLSLGYKELPDEWVKRADELTDEELRRFIIADNVGFGEHDWQELSDNWDLGELESWGLEFPDNWASDNKEITEDEYEVPEDAETEIKLGDLIEIGQHRLLCGDSTDPEQVARLMNGEKADMVFTDPPYGVDYSAKNAFLNQADKGNHIQKDIQNDTNPAETFTLWDKHFSLYKDILADVHSIYVASPQTRDLMMMMMMMMIEKGGIYVSNVVIWVKNNHVLGRLDYMLKHEPIIYGWLKGKTHKFYGAGDQLFSVWEYDKPVKNDLHPTMKPLKLIANALLNSSLEGQLVFDGFLGSGSTMAAAHQLNRKCYGLEIDPKYCQVIVDRMLKLDPDLAVKLNGEIWLL